MARSPTCDAEGCAGARFACNACLNFLAGLGISEPISPGWAAMERLSGLDAFFLYMETPSQPLNVCCVLELDTSTMPGGYTYGRFHAALEKYVKAAPEFRMKLADTELNLDHPVWVDDDNFQIRHHLRRVAMPAPEGVASWPRSVGTSPGCRWTVTARCGRCGSSKAVPVATPWW